jgi:hypothetical protein
VRMLNHSAVWSAFALGSGGEANLGAKVVEVEPPGGVTVSVGASRLERFSDCEGRSACSRSRAQIKHATVAGLSSQILHAVQWSRRLFSVVGFYELRQPERGGGM